MRKIKSYSSSRIISGDAAQKLAELKAEDGDDINMSGSATTVRWLLREGLLDELNLLVHPIVVGDGLARLFPPDEPTIRLELVSAQTFKTGVLTLSCSPATWLPDRGGTELRREQLPSSGSEDRWTVRS